MFSNSCLFSTSLFQVDCHCSFISESRVEVSDRDIFLKKPNACVYDSVSQKAAFGLQKSIMVKKKSLKKGESKRMKAVSMLKSTNLTKSILENANIQPDIRSVSEQKKERIDPMNGTLPYTSCQSSTLFKSQKEKPSEVFFGRYNFQRTSMEESQNIKQKSQNKIQKDYFRSIIVEDLKIPLKSNRFENTLDRQMGDSLLKEDNLIEEENLINIPNFFSHQNLKSSDERCSEERQISSTLRLKKKSSSRRKTHFEDLKFKDTMSIGGQSDHFSQVLQEGSQDSEPEHFSLAKIYSKKRTLFLPKTSHFK